MEYWWEGSTSTAISTTFASDVVGQHNKIGGINFGAALVFSNYLYCLGNSGSDILSFVACYVIDCMPLFEIPKRCGSCRRGS
jgi:hypothetical protein